MPDKDLEGQLEGLFFDGVPEPEAGEEKPLPEEAIEELLEIEEEAEPLVDVPILLEASPPIPTEPEEEVEQEGGEVLAVDPGAAKASLEAALAAQRVRALNILLGVWSAVGALIVGALMVEVAQRPGLLVSYAPYFVAYVVVVIVTLARRLSLTLRAALAVGLFYVVGVSSILSRGPLGPGALYLLIAPLVLSILFTRKIGAVAAVASIVVYTGLIVGFQQGRLSPSAGYDLARWSSILDLGGSFAMLVAVAALAQWMSNSAWLGALREAEGKRSEAVGAQTLLEERTKAMAAANAQLQKRALQLQTVAEVSQAVALVLTPDALPQRVVDLIRERFDLYFAGLFLVDESGRWAVLRAGTGEAGRRMLAEGHRVAVGEESAVGWCVANAQARVALDVGEEPTLFPDPLLPETRSQAVLPLISRGRLLGAVDMRSTEGEAFSRQDIPALQTLADQVAVTLDNAQVLAQTQMKLEEVEASQRRQARVRWTGWAPGAGVPFYQRTQGDAAPLVDTALPGIDEAMVRGEIVESADDGAGEAVLLAPINLRGEIIGVLGLHEAEGERHWTADEIDLIKAVADQMALAMENARLLAETQHRAERERQLAEITSRVRASVEVDAILQTAVRELGRALGASDALIRLGTISPQADRELTDDDGTGT
jgi:GAF domain-containing protein